VWWGIGDGWGAVRPRRKAATFFVKVKVHRGEPANEGADILADKAILDPKVGRE